ncbi:tRNA dimethylallyltransferase [TM7 phylum sp. oral taxon 350]|nr:tRNA dimethylallyltransferase [TM7 phylum sp. oral taxon 350]
MTNKVIFILGPTASGKTSVAIELAKRIGGEIISADSRAFYTGMDIATAKPSIKERQGIKHWGIDLINPGKKYSIAEFKVYCEEKIADIKSRGLVPIVVGGSGLYADSVIFNYDLKSRKPKEDDADAKLQKLSVFELQELIKKKGIGFPENYKNKRYLIRWLENDGKMGEDRGEINLDYLVFGVYTKRDELKERIKLRIDKLFNQELIDEYINLNNAYPGALESITTNYYPIIKRYLNKEIDLNEAKELAYYADWHLAKRQLTWLKRNKYIKWYKKDEIVDQIEASIRINKN